MTLIKSISGIRGTIGGFAGSSLTPLDVVKFTAAFGHIVLQKTQNPKIVLGRDARKSGEMINRLVIGTLEGMGFTIIDLGLSTTPTVEIAVPLENAGGGIILTASHNPGEWNALKLLNEKGEFIDAETGLKVLELAENPEFAFAEIHQLGKVIQDDSYLQKHIDHILSLDLVDVESIRNAEFKIAVDAVNSSGGIFVPALLKALGVKEVIELYCEPNGDFPHNPEPLPEHLKDLSELVIKEKANLGISVDPDVDRLCFVMENGEMFGEEYTLVAVADYILAHQKGPAVSNLSSTRALRDIAHKHGVEYYAAAVGEVNVVNKMKKVRAAIGGEGNGGIIYPETHYGRDALVGIALFLTHLAKSKQSISSLKSSLPEYFMSKNKISLQEGMDVDGILAQMQEKYKEENHSTIDGLKIDFPNEWVHLRKSNTEPIIRIYSEAPTEEQAQQLSEKIMDEIKSIAGL